MQTKLLVSLLLTMLFINVLMVGLRTSVVSATPVVDGVISPGEYYGGMSVQLIGRTDPNWTVDAYIDWDTEYLYVAVNEPVPATTGHISWIEFSIDPGPSSSYLYAFVLLDDHNQTIDTYHKPSGLWTVQGAGNFSAVSNVATEFMVKYTDYGIAPGDTIKLSIDRNQGPAPPPPYGFAAFWPQNATVYDGSPIQADPTTWGDVQLSLPPFGHVVDGIITQGEYSTGIAVQLVGRTDPNWTVAAYIDWDTEYLYVAVNEPVPATTGRQSWIEFAIDPGPSSSYLYAFVLLDDHTHGYDTYVKPSGPWAGQGTGNFSAMSGAATEFKVKYTDYGIKLGDTIKLSIDRNQGPPPSPPGPPYGFAAFWPQNATVYDGSPLQADPTTWGDVYLARRDVAVTNVTPAKTIVGRGYTGNITVATANLGGVIETFNTSAFANQSTIALLVNTTLVGGDSTMWTFSWNTTGLAYGDFTISATADTVPGETDTTNNNYTAAVTVYVGVPGDISSSTPGTHDGRVNMWDIAYEVMLFNSKVGSPNSNPNADVNDDGIVNMKDIAICVAYFNQHE